MDKTIHCVEKKYTKHKVIYGDTDSVMIHYTGKTVADAMQMGKELAGLVSSGFPPPITLEFETVYKPYLLVGKKKYAGGMYSSSSDSHKEVVVKGLDCIRRDCLPYAARIMDDCIKHIFDKADIDAALQIATEAVSKLRSGSVDSELTLTKTYNEAARAGDRIPYVICKELVTDEAELRKEYKARREEFSRVNLRKVAYRAEDPQYVKDHGLPIDYAYYEEQLMRSLNTLFEPMHRAIEVP
ncbi:hypothetical protein HPB50_005422 [Hyalomma asiaticum]|uniref:Uncharacterized protein n=1 Tax=Hyalomma asiaticum TaxID=266040 RepID=A0ACB7RJQ4_HYAAI|nr:hypothetical protein HPB50_005422 [Hyalomma asiaticum]